VIERLDGEFFRYLRVESVRWEHFQPQDIVDPIDEADIAVFILWARIGVKMPEQYRGALSGKSVTGTEYEWETALASNRRRGKPEIMVFRKTVEPTVHLDDYLRMREQRDELNEFWNKWFQLPDETFKAAYTAFASSEEFEDRLYAGLHALLERRLPPEVRLRA
jgi:hypothetical protein